MYETIVKIRKVAIVKNVSLETNKRSWNTISPDTQVIFAVSANSAVNTLIEFEPCILEGDDDIRLIRMPTTILSFKCNWKHSER